jgi:hypothetical protein
MRLQPLLILLSIGIALFSFSCEPETLEANSSSSAALNVSNSGACVTQYSRTIPNTLNLVKGDEWGNHGTYNYPNGPGIALPVYPNADFQYRGRVNVDGYYVPFIPIPRSATTPPQYWKWTIPWGTVYYPESEEALVRLQNLRIEIRNLRSYYFNQAQRKWIPIDTTNEIAGAYYIADFNGDRNSSANIVRHPKGSISVLVPPVDSVFHFFRGGLNTRKPVNDPANCVGFYTACEARLVKNDCADKRDNRNKAALYLGMGLDVWATDDADGSDPAFEYHQDAFFGRHRKLDANWRTYNGVALINNGTINLDAYPPPLK